MMHYIVVYTRKNEYNNEKNNMIIIMKIINK